MVLKARQPFGKDILYDFLGSEKFNWRRLLLLLAAIVVSFKMILQRETDRRF